MMDAPGTFKSISAIRLKRRTLRKYSWLPDVLRVKGSIIRRIAGPVLTVTLFATLVAIAHHKGLKVTLTNSVVPLLAVVVGLILVFRNGTSYDRYYEGRKDFGILMSSTRNLARLVWVNALLPHAENTSKATRYQVKTRKIRALKLILSYTIAVKHHLREEYETDYDDFIDVLPEDLFGKRREPLTISEILSGPKSNTSKRSSLLSNPPRETSPLIGDQAPLPFFQYSDEKKFPFPLIIAHEIHRMILAFKRDGLLELSGPAGLNGMTQVLASMVDALTAMERIINTPIPPSYGIHLKQCVTLYLFALPFTLVAELSWKMIPVVTVVAFTLMGIEGIANEIEMPFGKDSSDLPLDKYCAELRAETEYIIDNMPEGYEDDFYRD